MALVRLQNKVPPVYPDNSRDFQLFLHLYDVILNGLKYDIDGITHIINTETCKSTILKLLQTKLGFYTNKNFTDTDLRIILRCFMDLVKKKGTISAIKETLYMFLKINNMSTDVKVDIIKAENLETYKAEYGDTITDHTILIGIENSIKDISSLTEVLKYIIPFGYNVFFYYYITGEGTSNYTVKNSTNTMYIGNDINSAIAGSVEPLAGRLNTDEHTTDWDPSEYNYRNPDSEITKMERRQIGTISTVELVPIFGSEPDIVDPEHENTLHIILGEVEGSNNE